MDTFFSTRTPVTLKVMTLLLHKMPAVLTDWLSSSRDNGQGEKAQCYGIIFRLISSFHFFLLHVSRADARALRGLLCF